MEAEVAVQKSHYQQLVHYGSKLAYLPDACDCKPKKRQEISEFWHAEIRAEVIKRPMAGKYASFEPLSASH